MPESYPWWEEVTAGELQQGDLLDDAPILILPEDFDPQAAQPVQAQGARCRLMVMTASCDLEPSHVKVSDVVLCRVYAKSEMERAGIPQEKLGHIVAGKMPRYLALERSTIQGLEREVSLVDFGAIHTLPYGLLTRTAARSARRLRLRPPYREHISQGFARFFMRVGLPQNVDLTR